MELTDEDLVEPPAECEELNCSGSATTHNYGSELCDFLLTAEDGVIGKADLLAAQ